MKEIEFKRSDITKEKLCGEMLEFAFLFKPSGKGYQSSSLFFDKLIVIFQTHNKILTSLNKGRQ